MEETAKADLEARDEDRISELPDDLIYQILSCLDMISAAQTSILSGSWRYLWTNLTDLDFDLLKIDTEYDLVKRPSEATRTRYLNWVNQVVSAHHSPSIDRLRIFFPLPASYSSQIDSWLKFAISKRVKKIELDLSICEIGILQYKLGINVFKELPCDDGFGFLTSLRLSQVDVSGEFLEFMLLQCPLLEHLYVFDSKDLVGFKLMDSSCKCKLKRLGIRCCRNLEIVKIHSVSLEYLEFYDRCLDTITAPSLVGATVRGIRNPVLEKTVCISKQLTVLTLDLEFSYILGLLEDTLSVPSMCNVKHLTLRAGGEPECTLWVDVLERLMKACPVVCELKIEVYWSIRKGEEAKASEDLEIQIDEEHLKDYRDVLKEDMDTYPSLRVFEVVGFMGCPFDVELIWFIGVRALNLKTVICDPRCYFSPHYDIEAYKLSGGGKTDMKETSRCRASKLAHSLASLSSELTIIIR